MHRFSLLTICFVFSIQLVLNNVLTTFTLSPQSYNTLASIPWSSHWKIPRYLFLYNNINGPFPKRMVYILQFVSLIPHTVFAKIITISKNLSLWHTFFASSWHVAQQIALCKPAMNWLCENGCSWRMYSMISQVLVHWVHYLSTRMYSDIKTQDRATIQWRRIPITAAL